jgi:GTP cyclohydrolase II
LRKALLDAKAAGGGVVLYLNQEGRGIGLANKLKAYTLQDRGQDSFDANRHLGYAEDERDFAIAAVLLRHLGITHIQLMTNNPDKLKAMAAHGIIVEGRLAHHIDPNGVNDAYLQAKKDRRGHL